MKTSNYVKRQEALRQAVACRITPMTSAIGGGPRQGDTDKQITDRAEEFFNFLNQDNWATDDAPATGQVRPVEVVSKGKSTMGFTIAVQAMREGATVKREGRPSGLRIVGSHFRSGDDNVSGIAFLNVEDVTAMDWEVVQ